MRPAPRRLGLATALLLLLAGRALAEPLLRTELLWLDHPPVASQAPLAVPFSLPLGWDPGDAAVILVSFWSSPASWRDRLMAALTDAGAAVLELDVEPVLDTGHAIATAPITEALLPRILAALHGLWWQAGAGLVVAIGEGVAGEAALRATEEAEAARHLRPNGPHLTAGVALGEDGARFAAGRPPAPEQGWALRAPLFCALLGQALAAPQLPPDCVAALLPGASQPALAGRSRVR